MGLQLQLSSPRPGPLKKYSALNKDRILASPAEHNGKSTSYHMVEWDVLQKGSH